MGSATASSAACCGICRGRYFKPPAIDEREAPRWDSRSLGYSIPSPLRRKLAKRAAR
jgi:hypothetical protein